MNLEGRAECLSVPYEDSGKEGYMPVPGAVLHYRVAGSESASEVVVFENGWGALFPYAAWLEQALAPHVRLVCYDRAGLGNSTSNEPITTARITEQFTALIAGLGISQPVVVIGHSYGGLIAALHAAQASEKVRAVIQADPTPEYPYKEDKAMESAPTATRFTKLAIRFGLTRSVTSIFDGLPQDAFRRLSKSRSEMIKVIDGSIPEIKLYREIQSRIRTSDVGKRCPRLVVSAAPLERKGLLRVAFSQKKLDAILKSVNEIHRRQAAHNGASRWIQSPYNHYTMLANREGAEHLARSALDFMRSAVD